MHQKPLKATMFKEELRKFDDGHKPGSTTTETQLVHYEGKNTTGFFSVFEDLLPEEWCSRTYDYALEYEKPWGEYVSTQEALNESLSAEQLWSDGHYAKAIALAATRNLIFGRGRPLVGKDEENIHGTAVWCLSSGTTNSVNYHIDYQEMYRYETNTIYPPLYAGTCHVSPLASEADIIGGEFHANTEGIAHYARFGYKYKLASQHQIDEDLRSPNWVQVKYKFNRGIMHDGDFPHLSTPISYIKQGCKRVILGFNCFPHSIGEATSHAPEHSEAFNRTIKLYQTMAAVGVPIASTTGQKGGSDSNAANSQLVDAATTEQIPNAEASEPTQVGHGINASDLLKNPALARLIVAAAKKVKAGKARTALEK